MLNNYHPSKLAMSALGLVPSQTGLTPAQEDTFCTRCGQPVTKGDPVKEFPYHNDRSFMDAHDLGYRADYRVSCQWCVLACTKKVMSKCSGTLFTAEGAYPLKTDDNRAWFFLTPPKPPYLVTVANTRNTQHLVWRTPVTLDNEMISVRFGPNLYTIRHSQLMRQIDLCREAADIITDYQRAKEGGGKVKAIPHPFVCLDRNCSDPAHGMLWPNIYEITAKNEKLRSIVQELQRATLGELWALATLVKTNRPNPAKPEKIQL